VSEKDWIKKSQEGDEVAFEHLMLTYQKRIFFLCLNMVKDEGIALDLTQETFVHAYQHLQAFRGESKFYTWIYRIAKNLCLNFLKKAEPTLEFKENFFYEQKKTEEEDFSEEKKESLKLALEKLPRKHREVLELYEYQKIPTKMIASQLNIPEGTVRSRLHYARKKMRHFLKPL
jgi:RNA polymerase sigma-70 factor (ECF subfamily)